jgi:hypothetical protein
MHKVSVLGALALFATAALGASHDLKTFITEYDLDQNSSVSKEEFATERDRRFAATDANHDGGLSREEYVGEYQARLEAGKPDPEQYQRQMRQAGVRFGVLDANKNDRISPAEFAHSGWSMFTRHDANKDGAITSADAEAAAAKSKDE